MLFARIVYFLLIIILCLFHLIERSHGDASIRLNSFNLPIVSVT